MSLLELQSDPEAFRAALLIDTDSGPQPFSECIDEWQSEDFKALDSGWKRAVLGSKHKAKYQRGWLERPRGHAKTLDLAIMVSWVLFAARRRLSLIGCAADLDQARLLRDAIGRLVFCNPWLGKMIEVQNYRVINPNTESTLDIISSDAKSSYGLTPDGIICDEVVHWKNRDLWDAMISSAALRSTCMVVVITNAGLSDDWQWQTREAVRQDNTWFFSRLDGPKASWINSDLLAEQERLLPGIAYRRLWLNEWTSGGGDALTEEDINAAFYSNLRPLEVADPSVDYVGGLDLGVSRDASAVCILGIRIGKLSHGRIRLAFTKLWKPTKGNRVNLQQVEDTLLELHDRFNLRQFNYDPWEARHMASRLQSIGLGKMVSGSNRKPQLPMVEITPSGQNLQRIATVVIEAFNDRRVELFDDADLKRYLHRMRVEERSYGFRLTSPRDAQGHGDLGTAFCLAMLAASELAAKRIILAGIVGSHNATSTTGDAEMDRALSRFERNKQLYAQDNAEAMNDDSQEREEQAMFNHLYR